MNQCSRYNCALHKFVQSCETKAVLVYCNLALDNVEFFHKNFTRCKYFFCPSENLFPYAIVYKARRIIAFVKHEYPQMFSNSYTDILSGLLELLSDGISPTFCKQEMTESIYYIFDAHILHPYNALYKGRQDIFNFCWTYPSLHFFLAAAHHMFPRPAVHCTIEIHDAHREYNFNALSAETAHHDPCRNIISNFYHFGTSCCRRNVSCVLVAADTQPESLELKRLLFSFRILQVYYSKLMGSDVTLSSRDNYNCMDAECVDILTVFNNTLRVRSLLEACRRVLFKQTTYSNLRMYLNTTTLNRSFKNMVLLRNIDFIGDAAALRMKTFTAKYKQSPYLECKHDELYCTCCARYTKFSGELDKVIYI